MLKSARNWLFLLLIGMAVGVSVLIILSPPRKKSAQVTFITATFDTNGYIQISYREKQSSGTFLRHGRSGGGYYSWFGFPSSGGGTNSSACRWAPFQLKGIDPEVLKLAVKEGQTYTIKLGEALTLYDFTNAEGVRMHDELSLEAWKPQKDASGNPILP